MNGVLVVACLLVVIGAAARDSPCPIGDNEELVLKSSMLLEDCTIERAKFHISLANAVEPMNLTFRNVSWRGTTLKFLQHDGSSHTSRTRNVIILIEDSTFVGEMDTLVFENWTIAENVAVHLVRTKVSASTGSVLANTDTGLHAAKNVVLTLWQSKVVAADADSAVSLNFEPRGSRNVDSHTAADVHISILSSSVTVRGGRRPSFAAVVQIMFGAQTWGFNPPITVSHFMIHIDNSTVTSHGSDRCFAAAIVGLSQRDGALASVVMNDVAVVVNRSVVTATAAVHEAGAVGFFISGAAQADVSASAKRTTILLSDSTVHSEAKSLAIAAGWNAQGHHESVELRVKHVLLRALRSRISACATDGIGAFVAAVTATNRQHAAAVEVHGSALRLQQSTFNATSRHGPVVTASAASFAFANAARARHNVTRFLVAALASRLIATAWGRSNANSFPADLAMVLTFASKSAPQSAQIPHQPPSAASAVRVRLCSCDVTTSGSAFDVAGSDEVKDWNFQIFGTTVNTSSEGEGQRRGRCFSVLVMERGLAARTASVISSTTLDCDVALNAVDEVSNAPSNATARYVSVATNSGPLSLSGVVVIEGVTRERHRLFVRAVNQTKHTALAEESKDEDDADEDEEEEEEEEGATDVEHDGEEEETFVPSIEESGYSPLCKRLFWLCLRTAQPALPSSPPQMFSGAISARSNAVAAEDFSSLAPLASEQPASPALVPIPKTDECPLIESYWPELAPQEDAPAQNSRPSLSPTPTHLRTRTLSRTLVGTDTSLSITVSPSKNATATTLSPQTYERWTRSATTEGDALGASEIVEAEMTFAITVAELVRDFPSIRGLIAAAIGAEQDNITLLEVFEGSAVARMGISTFLRSDVVRSALERETEDESSALRQTYGAQHARVVSIDCTRACHAPGTEVTRFNANMTACVCECRGQFTGDRCDVCPSRFDGPGCDRCADGATGYPICGACAAPIRPQQPPLLTFSTMCTAVPEVATQLAEATATCDAAHCACLGGLPMDDAGGGGGGIPGCHVLFRPTACAAVLCAGVRRECLRAAQQAAIFPDACRRERQLLPMHYDNERAWCFFGLCSGAAVAAAAEGCDNEQLLYSSCAPDGGVAFSAATALSPFGALLFSSALTLAIILYH